MEKAPEGTPHHKVRMLKYRLIVHENIGRLADMDGEVIMETMPIEADCLMAAFTYFSNEPALNGMTLDFNLPINIPCGGWFAALSDNFAGKFWEIVGHLGD